MWYLVMMLVCAFSFAGPSYAKYGGGHRTRGYNAARVRIAKVINKDTDRRKHSGLEFLEKVSGREQVDGR